MTPTITPEQREALRSALEDEQLYSVLAEVISAKAVEKLEEKQARSRTFYLTLAAVVLSLLSAGLTLVVNEVLNARIADEVESAINSQFGALEFAPRIGAINADVRRIDASESVDLDEVTRIVDQIEALYERFASSRALATGLTEEKVIEYRNDLTYAIETMMKILTDIGNDTLVFRMSEIAPVITERSAIITQTLLQTYGRKLIAAPAGAAAWTESNGARVATFEKYRTYALRAEKQGYPELFIAFELLTRHMAKRPRAEIEQLAGRIEDLNEVDHDAFMQIMTSLATEGFKIEPDQETRLVAKRVREFLAEYADAADTLKDILESLPPLRAN